MQKKFTLLSLTFVLLVKHFAFSGHITGGEITYVYVSPNTYEVTLKLFHDCSGIALTNTQDICFSSASCGSAFTHTVNLDSSQELLQPACTIPGMSSCQGGSSPGVEEVIYNDTVTLTGACVDWVMSYSSCCTGLITTISNQPAIYIEARLNNVLAPTGSSPQFQNHALPWFCLNAFSLYDFACTDPDGDALQYTFDGCLDAGNSCPNSTSLVNYNIPYSPSNPLSSSTTITLNTSGLMTFTPNVMLTAVIKVKVNALGSGGITGSVMRQNVVTILNGITGIAEQDEKNVSVSVLPNVSERYFNYTINEAAGKKVKIKIFNAFGKVVDSIEPGIYNNTFTIDLAGFAGGMYFVTFIIGNEQRTEKIIKL